MKDWPKRFSLLTLPLEVKSNWLTEIERDIQEIGITETIISDRFTFDNYQFADKPNNKNQENLD